MCAIPSQSLHAECDVSAENAVTAEMTPTTQKTRGLCFDRKHQSWRCRIFYAGKQRHIGRFRDALDAAKAYDRAAYYLYGEKAIINFSMEEAAADHGSVPLFIRQAKEQAEAAAALAEATGADGTASASSSGMACISAFHSQGDATAAAAAAAARAAGMQPGLQQMVMQQPQQQQHQVYMLDSYGNIVCQPAPMLTPNSSSLQQLQQQQQQQLDGYSSPNFLQASTAMQQQQLDACGNLVGYQSVVLRSPCSMQQQQLASSPVQLNTAWASPGNLAHAELAAVPHGLISGTYTVTQCDSNSPLMYAQGDACIPMSSCADVRIFSSSGSTCSSQSVAMTAAMLQHSLAPVTLSSMHDNSALSVLPQAAGTAARCGSMQQLSAPGDVHIGDRMMLRQALEWQLQKQQSLPKSCQRAVQGLMQSSQAPVQPAAFLNSSSAAAAAYTISSTSTALPQAGSASSMGTSGGVGPLQQQSSALASSSSGGSNVQVLHMPAMPMPVQQLARPAALQAHKVTQQHMVQQQLPYGYSMAPAQPQPYAAVHCGPQQQQAMPLSVNVLTGMIQAGALQL